MLFLGQIGLTVLGGIITYFIIDLANDTKGLNWMLFMAPKEEVEGEMLHHINYMIVPIFGGIVISFVVSGLFVNLYANSIDNLIMLL